MPRSKVESDQAFASDVGAQKLQVTFPISPQRSFCFGVGPSVRPDVYPQLTAAAKVELVCMCGHLYSLGQDSLWSDADPCLGCLHNAMLVMLLCMDSSQGRVGRADYMMLARSLPVCCGREDVLESLWRTT